MTYHTGDNTHKYSYHIETECSLVFPIEIRRLLLVLNIAIVFADFALSKIKIPPMGLKSRLKFPSRQLQLLGLMRFYLHIHN